MNFIYLTFIFFFLVVSALLCMTILLQEPKSSGLGAAFGGGETSESVFGTSTADVLKKFTGYMVAIFIASCVLLSIWTSAIGRSRSPAAQTSIETLLQGE